MSMSTAATTLADGVPTTAASSPMPTDVSGPAGIRARSAAMTPHSPRSATDPSLPAILPASRYRAIFGPKPSDAAYRCDQPWPAGRGKRVTPPARVPCRGVCGPGQISAVYGPVGDKLSAVYGNDCTGYTELRRGGGRHEYEC